MQEAMYADELLSQLSFLRYHRLIDESSVFELRDMVTKGNFSEATASIESILDKYSIDKDSIKNFIDNHKDTHNILNSDSEDKTRKKSEPSEKEKFYSMYTREAFSGKNQFENKTQSAFFSLKKDFEAARNELNRYRARYREEKLLLEKTNEELLELSKEHQIITSKYEKLTSELQQKRIEDRIPDYVGSVSKKLDEDDSLFMVKSQRWSRTGIALSLAATLIALYTFKAGIDVLTPSENLGYITLIFVFFRGFLAIGILSWVAYLCFNMSSSYIHESILRKDRQHALSFGRLFLQIYGDTATKDDAIEVFKDWNRSGDSAFSKKTSSPPNLLKIIDLFKKAESSSKSEVG